MPGLTMHLDDFTLLRYAVEDLPDADRCAALSHLAVCAVCNAAFDEIQELDEEFRSMVAEGVFPDPSFPHGLASDDPFRVRPLSSPKNSAQPARDRRVDAVTASESALPIMEHILTAVHQPVTLEARIAELSPDKATDRFALLYALQEAGRRIGESPRDGLRLSKAATRWLRRSAVTRSEATFPGESLVSWNLLWGQAHILGAQAYLWTKEFVRAQGCLRVAYRALGRVGDETALAIVEVTESSRRSLSHDGQTALLLAERARVTFEDRGLDDLTARALVAEGLALFALGRQGEAVERYRLALPVFEEHQLWGNYIGTLNSLGTSLNRLGRTEEARRDYARALRRFSRQEHRSWLGFLREGLGDVLRGAGRSREAAISYGRAAQAYAETGLASNALLVVPSEVESWARAGDIDRAIHRLEVLRGQVSQSKAVDPSVVREIERSLSDVTPELERVISVGKEIEASLRSHLAAG